MATYKASPFYAVQSGNARIDFDQLGEFSTEDSAEIELLDGLVPDWIVKLDEVKPEEPAPKAPAQRKSSAK